MGKYIRKAKTAGEVAVMDISQASLGVLTRARTLALQRLKKSSTSPAPAQGRRRGSYLQLRSRRLENPPPVVAHHHDSKRHKKNQQEEEEGGVSDGNCGQNRSPNSISRVRVSGGDSGSNSETKKGEFGSQDIEASFGENILDFEARERDTRDSTPCSLIRDSESIRTPGSTTGPTNSEEINQRVQNSTWQNIPTSNEMDEFFTHAEVDQQRQFIEKYNFDPVKDKPLPGHYQWEKVDP